MVFDSVLVLTARLMCEALIQWAAAVLIVLGAGSLWFKIWRDSGQDRSSLETVWVGFAVVAAILYITNLFVGLTSGWVKLLLAALFISGVIEVHSQKSNRRTSLLFGLSRKKQFYIYTSALIVAAILANWTIGPPKVGDSSLYHIGIVDYAVNYRAIPGLVNLHSRLAFTSTTYMLGAVFQNGFWGIDGYRLASGFVALLFLFECMSRIRRIVVNADSDVGNYLILIGSAIVVLSGVWIPNTSITAPSPDLSAAILILVAFAYSARAFKLNTEYGYGLAICVATLSVSFRPLTVPLLSILLFMLGRKAVANRSIGVTGLGALFLSGLLMFGIVSRSVIVSGYLYYPSNFRFLNLDWAAPRAFAKIDLNTIESWAKTPKVASSEVLSSQSWIAGWIDRWKQYFALPMITMGFGTLMVLRLLVNDRLNALKKIPFLFVFSMVSVGAFWLLAAPDPRFAIGLIAVVVAMPASWILAEWATGSSRHNSTATVSLVVVLLLQYAYIVVTPKYPYSSLIMRASSESPRGLVPFTGGPTTTARLESSLIINVPTDPEGGCFRVELCAPSVNKMNEGLESRGNSIVDGFRTTGQ